MTIDTPQRRAGKRGRRAVRHVPELMLHLFRGRRAETAGPPPTKVDNTKGMTDVGMLGNDQRGNCGPCAVEHTRMVKALLSFIGGVATFFAGFIQPTTDHTESWYFAYGLAQGEPGPTPDQGVDNASMFAFLYEITEGKIPTPAGDDVQLWAYACLDPTDLDELLWGVADFGAVIIGQALPDNAEKDFEASPPVPWTIDAANPPDPNEGHDTCWPEYDMTVDLGTMLTWGGAQPFRVTEYVQGETAQKNLDAWVMVTEEDVKAGKISAEQFAQLVAACKAYGGTVASDTPTPEGAAA